jgi:hypothetical protein
MKGLVRAEVRAIGRPGSAVGAGIVGRDMIIA